MNHLTLSLSPSHLAYLYRLSGLFSQLQFCSVSYVFQPGGEAVAADMQLHSTQLWADNLESCDQVRFAASDYGFCVALRSAVVTSNGEVINSNRYAAHYLSRCMLLRMTMQHTRGPAEIRQEGVIPLILSLCPDMCYESFVQGFFTLNVPKSSVLLAL